MPELARFDGIIIRMYAEPGAPHHTPHFHAYYGGAVAVYAIRSSHVIEGSLPGGQHHKVVEWARAHRAELLAAWADLQAGRKPRKV